MEKIVVKFILSWVEMNLYSEAGVSKLVKEVGYCRSTVERWFRRNCGMTPGEYLMRRKMSRAAIILRMTVLSVTEIATLFHFHSSQNFARAFRKITGITPTQYRRQPEWQFSVLQQPLLMKEINFENLGECMLQTSTLYGPRILFQGSFLPSEENINSFIKKEIISKGMGINSRVCLASKVMPAKSLQAGRSEVLNLEVFFQSERRNNTDRSIAIQAGLYIHFRFIGTWSEYDTFSRLIYFFLAKERRIRRDGYDLVYFYFPQENQEIIDCQYFIPVTENK